MVMKLVGWASKTFVLRKTLKAPNANLEDGVNLFDMAVLIAILHALQSPDKHWWLGQLRNERTVIHVDFLQ